MMKIFTHYPLSISIDDDTYSIVVSDPTAEQKKQIEAKAKGLKNIELLAKKGKELAEDLESNKALVEVVGLVEKAKLLWENKNIQKEIREIDTQVSAFDMAKETTDLFMLRLEMTVSGEDKDRFLNDIATKSIDPINLVETISMHIVKSKEKK